MWKQIKGAESCKLLRSNNQLYTVPDALTLEYMDKNNPYEVIYYERSNDKPYVKIECDWNARGLWETFYYKWEE